MPLPLKTKKLKKGENISFRRGKIVVMKWKDKRDVTLLSTVHTSEMIQHQRLREVIRIPQIVEDYNHTMGGVDRIDQSLASYPVTRKRGKKYYKKIFFHILELALWNSYLLYKKYGQKRNPLEYRLDLIELMIEENLKEPPQKSKGRPRLSKSPLRLSGRHFPDICPSTEKTKSTTRSCAVCSKGPDANGKKVKRVLRYQCRECNVGLCVYPCFGIYHTKDNL